MTVFWRNVSKFAPKFVIGLSMRRIIHAFCGWLAAALVLTSCLNSNDSTTTVYDDMAIKTFSLGTLNRYLHTTTSEGKDSIYKTTYSASTFKINIDQLGHKIDNADSLLTGTDIEHVICNVTTVNNGYVYVKSTISDTLTYFTSGSDSIDFTEPRVFRVFSTDGSGSRDYTVRLNVRSQNAGTFNWTIADKDGFPVETDYAERAAAEKTKLTYIGRTTFGTYAMNAAGMLMKSVDDGVTWTEDSLDTEASLLPKSSLGYVTWTLDNMTDYALLIGKNPVEEKAMTLWRKLDDSDGDGRWVYMPLAEDNPYYLPVMDNVELVYYHDGILAFGSDKKIYLSRDQGITWKSTSTYKYPDGFSTTAYKVATDDSGFLWLTDTVSGQTWKGWLTK